MEHGVPNQGLAEAFNKRVLSEYRGARRSAFTKSVYRYSAIESGHPAFTNLAVGERRSVDMASVFLDLTNFTGRTFWDSADEVADLAHSVLSGFTLVITQFGGHVLGLRGDGLFAGFGPTSDPRVAVAGASLAAATALALVQDDLNPALKLEGVAPVQARVGADYGKATFIRSGTDDVSEVNVIGFSSNFAAKCEKVADSWEMVIGEDFAQHIADPGLVRQHADSPKRYMRDGESRSYRFYDYKWRPITKYADSTATELGGRALELVY